MDSETSSLRRLDALFAEKVLGASPFHNGDGELVVPFKHDMNPPWTELIRLPSFTRSLDAAWDVAAKIAWIELRGPYDPEQGAYSCCVGEKSARTPHPAEALVLACLRAVGVTEEEIHG